MFRERFSRRGPQLAEQPRLPSDVAQWTAMDRRNRAHAAARRAWMFRPSRVVLGGLGLAIVVVFALGFWQQSFMMPFEKGFPGLPFRGGGGRPPGSVLRFVPADLQRRFEERGGLDRLRSKRELGIRSPSVALVMGSMNKDSQCLMLLTLVRHLAELGYSFTVFALEHGEALHLWERAGYKVSFVKTTQAFRLENDSIDWSNYEGVILSSLEGKKVIASLMQEPFISVPLVWLIQEDILGRRISHYRAVGWQDLISEWRNAFSRADVVVFPDFSLPLLYSLLDAGNFFVIPGSPGDVWATQSFIKFDSRYLLRKDYGFGQDDLLILVIGSHLFYDELPWDYVTAMRALAPHVMSHTRLKDLEGTIKFVFMCGNSSDASGSFQEISTRLGFPEGSVRHYGMDHDVDNLLLMADSVLYGSFEEEQSFPPVLVRAMSFGIPIVAPDLTTIKKYVTDQIDGFIFHPSNPESLAGVFSHLIEHKKLSSLAHDVASNAKITSMNMLASDCIAGYANLLEGVLQFPSDVMPPNSFSPNEQISWLWEYFEEFKEEDHYDLSEDYRARQSYSIVYLLEQQYVKNHVDNSSRVENVISTEDFPTKLDWDIVSEMEISEDLERREMQELMERTERTLGSWEDVYRNARKAEKLKFEANERDEGELERSGRSLCIYEIYRGEGSWPFLHSGSLYRGISLLRGAKRSRADDLDAVSRLPILNETYYRDVLCELGAMFAVANRVDSIHKLPWIGFQSWQAAGRKVSLSDKAAEALEKTILSENKGDVIYYWALMDMNQMNIDTEDFDFWSMCDSLNNGYCRFAFAKAFREMYGLPDGMEALPPMPIGVDQCSVLHSWVMPTPSFLEFVMFARMFADSLDSLNKINSNSTECMLGSSMLEKKHCYCRIFEVLVNVWAYHSARRMVYVNPINGTLEERNPPEHRDVMWLKYFRFPLLKSMDEDLAQEADDGTHGVDGWLWPLTGEVVWQGVLDREREEKYRRKMDKKRKLKEKLLDRHNHGYKQKTLGQEQKGKI